MTRFPPKGPAKSARPVSSRRSRRRKRREAVAGLVRRVCVADRHGKVRVALPLVGYALPLVEQSPNRLVLGGLRILCHDPERGRRGTIVRCLGRRGLHPVRASAGGDPPLVRLDLREQLLPRLRPQHAVSLEWRMREVPLVDGRDEFPGGWVAGQESENAEDLSEVVRPTRQVGEIRREPDGHDRVEGHDGLPRSGSATDPFLTSQMLSPEPACSRTSPGRCGQS
jgi:hypothetical protein